MVSTGVTCLVAGAKALLGLAENVADFAANVAVATGDIKSTILAKVVGLFSDKGEEAILDWRDKVREFALKSIEYNITEESFAKLYEADIMQAINEGSYVKYGDQVFMIIEGVVRCIPIGIVTSVCPPAGIALAGVAGAGQSLQETLTSLKDSSREGIIERYNNGEISEETYKMFQTVWNMTEEEYNAMIENPLAYNMSLNDIETIKYIRNMNETWTDQENYYKSNAVAVVNGGWEAFQWGLGVGLNKLKTLGGSKLLASLFRVGTDTIFNGADIPFRSFVSSLVFGTEYKDEYEKRGGDEGVLSSLAVGGLLSGLGELKDLIGGIFFGDAGKGNSPDINGKNTAELAAKLNDADVDTNTPGTPKINESGEIKINDAEVGDVSGKVSDTKQDTTPDTKTDTKPDTNQDVELNLGKKETEEVKLTKENEKVIDTNSPEFNEVSVAGMTKRFEYAIQKMKEYFRTHIDTGVKESDVDRGKAKFYETDEKFEERLLEDAGDNEYIKKIVHMAGAFYSSGDDSVNFRPSNSYFDAIHEKVHSLGHIVISAIENNTVGESKYRAINEAFTEFLAYKIADVDVRKSGAAYKTNAFAIDTICDTLNKLGYNGVENCYFDASQNKFAFRDALRELTGSDDFLEELSELMVKTEMFSPYSSIDEYMDAMPKLTDKVLEIKALAKNL